MLISALVGVGALLAPVRAQDASGRPPNVVVVLLDDVGRDKIAAYGRHPSPVPTPELDRVIERGVLFENVWAAQSCSPTRAALLTGRHARRTGIGAVIRRKDETYLPLSMGETILPEVLTEYTSHAFGKWHLDDSGDPPTAPLDAGFAGYRGFGARTGYFDWQRNIDGRVDEGHGYHTTVLVDDALAVLASTPEPYFLYVCPLACHAPYHVPPAALHGRGEPEDDAERYAAMLEALDRELGRLYAAIDLDDTLLLVMGDNGSPREVVLAPWQRRKAKGSLFEGGLAVPFVVAGPGVARGQRCRALVGVTDVFATLAEVTGTTVPVGLAEDSISFAPQLGDPRAEGARRALYAEKFLPAERASGRADRAVRTERWKLIQKDGRRDELYDLALDPHEERNLLALSASPYVRLAHAGLRSLMPSFP